MQDSEDNLREIARRALEIRERMLGLPKGELVGAGLALFDNGYDRPPDNCGFEGVVAWGATFLDAVIEPFKEDLAREFGTTPG